MMPVAVTPGFAMACVRYLATDSFVRVCASLGVSQEDMDLFRGQAVWTPDLRVRMRRVLDVVVYGVCDLGQLPRVEVPAEIVAACAALLVNPANWMSVAAYSEGLRPAMDLSQPEANVAIERLASGRLFVLILQADSALHGSSEYEAFSASVVAKLGKYDAASRSKNA